MTTTDPIGDWETQLANCRDYWLGWGAVERIDRDLTLYRSGVADWQLNGVLRVTRGSLDDALAEARKRLARERGLRIGCLQATPPGLPVYERMGFQTIAETRVFSLSDGGPA